MICNNYKRRNDYVTTTAPKAALTNKKDKTTVDKNEKERKHEKVCLPKMRISLSLFLVITPSKLSAAWQKKKKKKDKVSMFEKRPVLVQVGCPSSDNSSL